jgi:hypothetical protein
MVQKFILMKPTAIKMTAKDILDHSSQSRLVILSKYCGQEEEKIEVIAASWNLLYYNSR